MTTEKDSELDNLLKDWANDGQSSGDTGNDAFIAKLTAIAQDYQQVKAPLFKRALRAMGGWGFATPQLAGLIVAAWLGVTTGSLAQAQEDIQDDLVSEVMGQHIFGEDVSYEG